MRKGLIGAHLQHSYSKLIHESLTDYSYDLIELNAEEFDQFMKEKQFDAINVTIPYKEKVIPYLDELDDSAKVIGAVNTIVQKEGKLIGYNTDVYGFLQMMVLNHFEIKGKKVIVLGNGGACKAVCAALTQLEAKQIIKVKKNPSDETITYQECYALHADAEVIINTSPVGMYPNIHDCPIDLEHFKSLKSVGDVIYNPLRTKLLIKAQDKGCKVATGLMMLVAQAIQAIEIFTGKEVEKHLIEEVTYSLNKEKLNMVLIGMPGCGKSTLAKKLAKAQKMKLIEVDELIEERIQMPIKDFITSFGEEKFRDIESEVALEIAKETHCVISCGGGIIKRSSNMEALKMNGKLIFIDRDLDLLAVTDSRPLSSDSTKLKQLYEERIALYHQYSEATVQNNGSIKEAVKACLQQIERG